MADPHTSQSLDKALERWLKAGAITDQQADAIRALEVGNVSTTTPAPTPVAGDRALALTPSQLITYIGGVLVVVASVVFVGLGWSDMGPAQQFFWALLAVAIPWIAGWATRRTGQRLAVQISPVLFALGSFAIMLLAYTFYRLIGVWPEVSDRGPGVDTTRRLMGTAQAFAGLAALFWAIRLRTPWLLLPAGVLGWMAWMAAMDPGTRQERAEWYTLLDASYGILLVVIGIALAMRSLRRWSFWLFLVGLTTTFLTLGPRALERPLAMTGLVFLALTLCAIVLSVTIDFRILLLYGSVALYAWVSALVIETFGGSRPVAFALILLGAVVVAGGVMWQRKHPFDRIDHHGDGGIDHTGALHA